MNLAFLGLKQAFDFSQIGGTESFTRRLSTELIKNNAKVDYILYGGRENNKFESAGISLNYFASFNDALKAVEKNAYDHIITIYLLPKDRIKYALFRENKNKLIRFHFIYFGWPDSLLKRKLYFSEARFFPYNGKLFCISKRQYEYASQWSKNAVYLLPPVPESYFLRPDKKPTNEKIKVTFLGRIDPGKGINEVIEIFKALKGNGRFECSIYGIHIPEHKESLFIHIWLRSQEEIKYIEVERQKYSPAVDTFVSTTLKKTDVFIQPYQRLSSTIDTPLLLLESMASLCAVLTKPFGNIPDIYGKSIFLIQPKNFARDTIKLLKDISIDDLVKERERIYERNNTLNFKPAELAKKFIDALRD
jgi:glycosyltransferase involved in cell wall biosynthesis